MKHHLNIATQCAQELARYLAMAEALQADDKRAEVWLRGAVEALHQTASAMGHAVAKHTEAA